MTTKTLHDTLEGSRAQLFVGRESELDTLAEWTRPQSDTTLIYVRGIAGSGKTELLAAFARQCKRRRIAVASIDARSIEPTPYALTRAYEQASADRAPKLLILDSLDAIPRLARWLRTEFLPGLPADLKVVLAGRGPLASAWSTDAGWHSRLTQLALPSLSLSDTAKYLDARGIDAARAPIVHRESCGHPLALSLFVEADLEVNPTSVKSLLDRILPQPLNTAQRHALWSCALAPGLTEDLLRSMVDEDKAPQLFEWLTGLSFVETTTSGLVLAPLPRAAILRDLGWRDLESQRTLLHRAGNAFLNHIERAADDLLSCERERAIPFLARCAATRFNAPLEPDHCASDARAEDWKSIEILLETSENADALATLRFWKERAGELVVTRDADQKPTGFALGLWLHETQVEDASQDPGTAALFAHLDRSGALDGRPIYYIRSWMSADGSQAHGSPAAHAVESTLAHYALRGEVSYAYVARKAAGQRMVATKQPSRIAEASFKIGTQLFEVEAHDFESEPPTRWLRRKALQGAVISPDAPLDSKTFRQGVKTALRFLDRPDRLQQNPLVTSSLTREAGASPLPGQAARVLGNVIRQEVESLRDSPSDEIHYRVLERTYIDPAPKQSVAAEELQMSYATYRRRHADALERITEALWHRESLAQAS